jgi:hypothetical protein
LKWPILHYALADDRADDDPNFLWRQSAMVFKVDRIDDFQKRELIEIRVPGADSPNSVLAHENCGVSVVYQITGDMRQLENHVSGDLGMPVGRDKNGEPWRGKQCHDEVPSRRCGPRPSHDAWMGRYAHKLVENSPGRVPSIGSGALAFKPSAARAMKLRVTISGIN